MGYLELELVGPSMSERSTQSEFRGSLHNLGRWGRAYNYSPTMSVLYMANNAQRVSLLSFIRYENRLGQLPLLHDWELVLALNLTEQGQE